MNSTKGAHESQRVWIVQKALTSHKGKIQEPSRGLKKIELRTIWEIYPLAAPLGSVTEKSTSSKFQDLDMRIQGSQKLPNEWCSECQVACRDKHMCIDKF